ncbi:MAG: nucleotidyltransferase domain-containing protein [Prevotellaceae bacterium]|jgi:predicted nucleotidyltransferase|nr:nucleotidyltransferase domain-containing protein [Prevotellaceae bacterium]
MSKKSAYWIEISEMDKRENIIGKVKRYKQLVAEQFPLPIDQFWLFGSYAKNTAHKDSDIDVALVVNQLDKDYSVLNTEPILWRLKREIDFRIEPHVIARDNDYAGMLNEIQQTGVLII